MSMLFKRCRAPLLAWVIVLMHAAAGGQVPAEEAASAADPAPKGYFRIPPIHVPVKPGIVKPPGGAGTWHPPPLANRVPDGALPHLLPPPAVQAALKRHGSLLRPLADIGLAPGFIEDIPLAVQQFSEKFLAGAAQPDDVLRAARRKHRELVDQWLNTPEDKRVFLVGSAEDDTLSLSVRQRLQAEGHTVFFYLECLRAAAALCAEEAVGAFCRTSHHVVVMGTRESLASPYVPLESRLAQQMHPQTTSVLQPKQAPVARPPGEAVGFVITPEALLPALRTARAAAKPGAPPPAARVQALVLRRGS